MVVQKAVELLPSLRARGLRPNAITYNVIIGACGSAGRYKEAEEVFNSMRTDGATPDAVSYGKPMSLLQY